MVLGPNSNPGVPKLEVKAIPVTGSVLTPKAKPKSPSSDVAACPVKLIVGLITKLKLPTLVVAS